MKRYGIQMLRLSDVCKTASYVVYRDIQKRTSGKCVSVEQYVAFKESLNKLRRKEKKSLKKLRQLKLCHNTFNSILTYR